MPEGGGRGEGEEMKRWLVLIILAAFIALYSAEVIVFMGDWIEELLSLLK